MADSDLQQYLQGVFQSSAAIATKLVAYVRLLEKWSAVHNLTGARRLPALASLVADCAPLVKDIATGPTCVADLGAGAGMPGLPLALLRPDASVTLIESRAKKVSFMRAAAVELGIGNVEIVHHRIETWQPNRTFVFLCARAVCCLAHLAKIADHLTTRGSFLLALKSRSPNAECRRLERNAGWLVRTIKPTGFKPSRFLVRAEKIA